MTVKPSHCQTVTLSNLAMRTGPRRGSVLMEAVLCLPVLLLLVSGIWQFSRILEARFFTWLAAYNAARATLVYNNLDYAYKFHQNEDRMEVDDEMQECRVEDGRWVFYEQRGIAWLAAVNTLAWISQTPGDGEDDWYAFPRYGKNGRIPNSARIKDQVRIVSELEKLRHPEDALLGDLRYSAEEDGYVRVSVEFKLPLLLSIFDPSLVFGCDDDSLEQFRGVEEAAEGKDGRMRLGKTFALRETVVLPKPYSTEAYPRVSLKERLYLLDAAEGVWNVAGMWGNTSDLPGGSQ